MRFLKLRTEIEKQVRLNLHDPNDYDTYPTGSDAHWDRDTMLFFFNRGVEDIFRKRPEAQLSDRTAVTFVEFTVANHTADSFTQLSDNFFNLIVNYISWQCYDMDDVDEESARKAEKYQARYYGGI